MLRRIICCYNSNDITSQTKNNVIDVSITDNSDMQLNNKKKPYNPDAWFDSLDAPVEWSDTISFVPSISRGFCIKTYDGDTITIAAKLPYEESPTYRFTVRLNGIDCPEIKGKTEDEKECAQLAKTEINKLVYQKTVTLKNIKIEKYGRILADVYVGGLNVNNHLLEKRLAVRYDGGTKNSPQSWMKYHMTGDIH